MKLGILGGTFDPIHQGHLMLAQAARKQFQLDKVLLIPALIPPHKTHRRDISPAPYRFHMVELAIENEPGLEISRLEFDRPEISYTVETLKALREKYPAAEFFLIVGADAVAEIPNWKESGEIQKMATVLAASRPGYPELKVEGRQRIEMVPLPLSSSEIREKLEKGEVLGPAILPAKVETYIRHMNLYRKTVS